MNYPTVDVLIDGLNLSHEVLLIPQTSLTKEAQNRKPQSEFRMIRAQSSSLLTNFSTYLMRNSIAWLFGMLLYIASK